MKCNKCGAEMQWDGNVCACNPPKYVHRCLLCGNVEYADSPDVPYDEITLKPHIVPDGGDVKVMLSPKCLWISETVVKLIAEIPYEYVGSGAGGQTMEARHIYAARIAKEMADVIFGENNLAVNSSVQETDDQVNEAYHKGRKEILAKLPKWKIAERDMFVDTIDFAVKYIHDGGDHSDYEGVVVTNRVKAGESYLELCDLDELLSE